MAGAYRPGYVLRSLVVVGVIVEDGLQHDLSGHLLA